MSGTSSGSSFPVGRWRTLNRVELRALVIEGVGEERVIVAPGRRAEREIGLARRKRIAVEQHFRLAAATGLRGIGADAARP